MTEINSLQNTITKALDDMKAKDITILDVAGLSSITDRLIIASGTSTRHVRSIAEAVAMEVKKLDHDFLGIEGHQNAEWVIVDLNEIMVHVMLPDTRDYYHLEKLWSARDDRDTDATVH